MVAVGIVTGWRHRLPRHHLVRWQDWSRPRRGLTRRRVYRSALTGMPVEVVVPTTFGRVVMWWRGL